MSHPDHLLSALDRVDVPTSRVVFIE